jgi:hypothetical protein
MGGRLRFPNPLHACSFQAPKAKPHRGSVEPAGSGARYKPGASEPTRSAIFRVDGQIGFHPGSFGAHHGCGGGPILGDVLQDRASKGQELQGAMLVGRRI